MKTLKQGEEVPVIQWDFCDAVKRLTIEPVVCPARRVFTHEEWAQGWVIFQPFKGD